MTRHNNIILLDVGGTFIKSALGVAGKGALEGTFMSTPISSSGTREEIAAAFREAVSGQIGHAAEAGQSVCGISMAIPGPFDYNEGIFLMKHKFAAVYGVSVRELLADLIGPQTRLAFMHDVNCALLGAIISEEDNARGNVALATLGTGLGFTYAKDGEIQIAESGSPAQGLWNTPYKGGILEDYVSRRGILRLYAEQGGVLEEGMDVKEVSELARKGDEKALAAFRKAGETFADAAKDILVRLDIRKVMFGGNISRSFDLIEPAIRERLPEDILTCALPDISGAVMTGAASL